MNCQMVLSLNDKSIVLMKLLELFLASHSRLATGDHECFDQSSKVGSNELSHRSFDQC